MRTRLLQVILRNSLLFLLIYLCISSAQAAGFQLFEQSVSSEGNAFAGSGASIDDASIEFYNPAGMTFLDNPQVVLGGTWLDVNIESNVSSATNTMTIGPAPGFAAQTMTQTVTGQNPSQIGFNQIVPELHVVYPYNHKVAFGFGITSPYGLETFYPVSSLSRFFATTSKLLIVNLGPSVAFQLTKKLSFGAGLDLQYLQATLNQQVPFFAPVIPFVNPTPRVVEGSIGNEATNWAYGWNIGGLYQFTPATRLGLSYRSRIEHDLQGDATLHIATPIIGTQSGQVYTNFIIPASANLSAYHRFNQKWAIKGSMDYTFWHEIQSLDLTYSGGIAQTIQSASLPLELQNTIRYSLGGDYYLNQKWTLRTGVAFDPSPVRDETTRTFQLPDSNRFWVALGARYQFNKYLLIDAAFAHLFVNNAAIDSTRVNTSTAHPPIPFLSTVPSVVVTDATGNFNSSVNEFGLQLTWNFI